MRRTQQGKNIFPLLKRWTIVISGLSVIILCIIGLSKLFLIRTVECKIASSTCSAELTASVSEKLSGTSIFFVNHSEVLKNEVLPEPVVFDLLYKKMPSTVVVQFQPEISSYAIVYENKKYQVSSSGKLFLTSPPTDISIADSLEIITITTSSAVLDNYHINPVYHAFVISLLESLKIYHIDIDSIIVSSTQQVELETSDKDVYIMDMSSLLASMEKLVYIKKYLQTSELQQQRPYVIDVRFRQPVLRSRQ